MCLNWLTTCALLITVSQNTQLEKIIIHSSNCVRYNLDVLYPYLAATKQTQQLSPIVFRHPYLATTKQTQQLSPIVFRQYLSDGFLHKTSVQQYSDKPCQMVFLHNKTPDSITKPCQMVFLHNKTQDLSTQDLSTIVFRQYQVFLHNKTQDQ